MDEEAQRIVNKYAGTGKIQRNANRKWNNKEIVTVDRDIGINIDFKTGRESTTNCFVIHYSKKGTHIVPIRRAD